MWQASHVARQANNRAFGNAVSDTLTLAEPLRTLALMRSYADATGPLGRELRDLIKIRDRASFQPPRADPDRKWWDDHIGNP